MVISLVSLVLFDQAENLCLTRFPALSYGLSSPIVQAQGEECECSGF